MSQSYTYTAVNAAGEQLSGELLARTKQDAAALLHQRGLIPLHIGVPSAATSAAEDGVASQALKAKKKSAGGGLNANVKLPWSRKSASTKDLVAFTQDLAALLEAGVPLARSLKIVSELIENKRFKLVVEDQYEQIKQGSTFWQALEKYPAVFPALYVNMVKAGEAGGVLDSVLQRLAIYLDNAQELKEYLLSSIIYPVFLLLTSIASIIVLLAVVVPKFAVIFADMGVALPLATKIMLQVGTFLQHWWWLLLLASIALYAALRAYAASENGSYTIDTIKLRLPLIGSIVKRIEISRFCRTLGTLLDSGIPILLSLQMVRGLLSNRILADSIDRTCSALKQGAVLSQSLADEQLFPSMAVQMIAIGEETGNMETMLTRLADMYDRELKVSIKAFTSLFEPLVILLMGLIIGAMVVSMLMAIFSINDLSM